AARAASLDPPGVRAVDRPRLPRRGRADRAARRALARERAAVEPAQDGGAARGEDARARVRRRVVRSGAESDRPRWPVGAGAGRLRCPGLAARLRPCASDAPGADRLRRRSPAVATAISAARSRIRRQERACLRELWACGALTGQLDQPREVALRLCRVAALRGGLAGAVVAAEALGLAHVRGLELLQRLGGALEGQQHLAEQLARGRDPRRGHDVLLALVLDVRRAAHEAECLLLVAERERRPGCDAEPAHLDLGGPVLVL